MTFAARAVLLLVLGCALFLTLRLAVAEADFRRDAGHSLDSPFWLRAEHLVRPDSTPEQLRIALSLNPRLSSAWIFLGLDAEADGNLPEAETDLLQAADINRQYLPAWTLANFYFRRGDALHFWPWAARAAVLARDEYRPLLRLADAFAPSAQFVVARLGGSPPLLRAYMDILIGAGRLDAAQEVARMLIAHHDPSDQARLADLADRVSRGH